MVPTIEFHDHCFCLMQHAISPILWFENTLAENTSWGRLLKIKNWDVLGLVCGKVQFTQGSPVRDCSVRATEYMFKACRHFPPPALRYGGPAMLFRIKDGVA